MLSKEICMNCERLVLTSRDRLTPFSEKAFCNVVTLRNRISEMKTAPSYCPFVLEHLMENQDGNENRNA